MLSFSQSLRVTTTVSTTRRIPSSSVCSLAHSSPCLCFATPRARAPAAHPTPAQQNRTAYSNQQSLDERIASLEAGGYWDITRARSIVEDAAQTFDCALALRALYAFENAGFYASRSLSTCVLTLFLSLGRALECLHLLERLYEPFIERNGIRVELPTEYYEKRKPNARMVTVAANCAARMVQPEIATAIVNAMKRAGDVPNAHVYSVLMKAYGKAGYVSSIGKVLEEARAQSCTDIALYNAAVDAYMRCKEWSLAQDVIKTAEEDKFSLESRTFNPLLREYARVGNIDEALTLVSDMRHRGIAPSDVTINTLMQAAVRGGRLDVAHRILGRTLSEGPWSKHKLIGYTTMISGLAGIGRFSEAFELMSEMASQLGPGDAMGGGEMEGGCAHDGAAALSLPLAALITALLNRGDVENAWRMFRGMGDIPVAPDAYRALIRGLAQQTDAVSVRAAEDVLSEMVKMFWDRGRPAERTYGRFSLPYELNIAHNAVMEGLGRIREPERAERVLRSMQKVKIALSAISYTAVINAYSRIADMTNAERILGEMRSKGVRPDRVTLNALLGGYARAGNVLAAEKVFRYMRNDDSEISPNVTSYSALISAYLREQYTDAAWQAYEELKLQGLKPGSRLVNRMVSLYLMHRSEDRQVRICGLSRERWLEKTKIVLRTDMNECVEVEKSIGERWARLKDSDLR